MSLNKCGFVCLFFLLVLIFMGMGVVSATNITDSDSSDVNTPVPIVNMEKNLKTEPVMANNYSDLVEALSSHENEQVVNLDSSHNYNSTKSYVRVNSDIKNLTINGNGAIIDGNNRYGFLKISSGTNVTLRDLTIRNMHTSTNGGAIENNGTLHIINCSLLNNEGYNGGAIVSLGDIIIEDCIISNNIGQVGGALYLRDCSNIIYNSTISNNTASLSNTLYIQECYTNMSYNNITDNNCNFSLVNIVGGSGSITYNNFTDNHMENSLILSDGTITIRNNTFRSNVMEKGYVVSNSHIMNITGNIFDDNSVKNELIHSTTSKFKVEDNVYLNCRLNTEITDIDDYLLANDDNLEFDVYIVIADVYHDYVHNGTVILRVDNSSFEFDVNNGIAHVVVASKSFKTGVSVVNVSYMSLDDSYQDCESNFTVTFYRDTSIVIDCDSIINSYEEYDIVFEVYDLIGYKLDECVLDVKIGGDTRIVRIEGGQGILKYTFGYDDSYLIEAFYTASGYYYNSNSTKRVTTKKVGTYISAEIVSDKITDTRIDIKVLDDDDKVLGNVLVNVKLENGTSITHNSTQPLSLTLNEGSHSINISFEGMNEYNASEKIITLDIEKIGTNLTAEVLNTTVDNVTVRVTLLDEFGENIENANITLKYENNKTIIIDTTPITGTTKNIITTINTPGTHNITATYEGNNIYKTSSQTIQNIQINKHETSLTTTENTDNDMVTITATLTDKETQKGLNNQAIIIKEENRTLEENNTNTDGTTTLTINLTPGTHNLTIIYNGNQTQDSTNTTKTITIKPHPTTITIKTTNTTAKNTTIQIKLKDNQTQKTIPQANITITLPDTTTININTGESGTATATLDLPSGSNTITLTYDGSNNYNNTTTTYTIDVQKLPSNTTVTKKTGYIGENITLTATVTDTNGEALNGGRVIFKLNGITLKHDDNTTIYADVTSGQASISYHLPCNWQAKTYKLEAVYTGDDQYNPSRSNTPPVNLKQRQAQLDINTNPTIQVDQTLQININIKDKQDPNRTINGYIILKIDGLTFKDNNGEAIQIQITDNHAQYNYTIGHQYSARKHTITAILINQSYIRSQADNTFNATQTQTTMTLNTPTINNINQITLTGTIRDEAGHTLTGINKAIIKINGITLKTNNRTPQYYTIQDGQINITLTNNNLKEGEHTITIVTGQRGAFTAARANTTITTTTKTLKSAKITTKHYPQVT